jgi:hypothetical protein
LRDGFAGGSGSAVVVAVLVAAFAVAVGVCLTVLVFVRRRKRQSATAYKSESIVRTDLPASGLEKKSSRRQSVSRSRQRSPRGQSDYGRIDVDSAKTSEFVLPASAVVLLVFFTFFFCRSLLLTLLPLQTTTLHCPASKTLQVMFLGLKCYQQHADMPSFSLFFADPKYSSYNTGTLGEAAKRGADDAYASGVLGANAGKVRNHGYTDVSLDGADAGYARGTLGEVI